MKHKHYHSILIALLILIIFCPVQLLAQAKVGTTAVQFLQFQFSARSLSMGAVGITMIDEFASVNSPGALGLYYSDHRATLFTLLNSHLPASIGIRAYGVGAQVLSRPATGDGSGQMTLAMAYTGLELNTGEMIEHTYQQGTGSGEGSVFSAQDRVDIFSVAMALQGAVEFGVGVNYKRIGSSYYSYSASGSGIDIGGMFRLKNNLSPSSIKHDYSLTHTFGAGLFNLGGDIKFIEQSSSLPSVYRLGLSHQFEILAESHRALSFLLVNELTKGIRDNPLETHYSHGIELGLADAVCFRVGTISGKDIDASTYGFGLNLNGLLDALSFLNALQTDKGTVGWLNDHADLSYDYGYADPEDIDDFSYQKISLIIK